MDGIAIAEAPTELLTAAGTLRFNRRLSDKILAAFNHAYALGEGDIARALRRLLETNEKKSGDARRRGDGALGHAELWVAFVDARDDYRAARGRRAEDSAELAQALNVMKGAYAAWLASAGA